VTEGLLSETEYERVMTRLRERGAAGQRTEAEHEGVEREPWW
jgi:hypothetical protein